jgi:starch synthase
VKVVHVASEVAPFSKTGGLADVLGALPRALRRLGIETTVVTPRYRSVKVDLPRRTLSTYFGPIDVLEGDGLCFVDHPESFDRPGIYGEAGGDYADNARRFAVLGAAAVALGPEPDLLHGHDWQAGPAIVYAHARDMKKVLTVHNLAYMGLFSPSWMSEVNFPGELFHPGGAEFHGYLGYLKAGLALADKITTVSPRYAREIQTEEQGYGLAGLLSHRQHDLIGILNGCDYDVWNPETDLHLPARYSAANLDGKAVCKAALQKELGLPLRPRTPLCGSVSRLAGQKGFDLVAEVLPTMLEGDVQYVVLGSGQPEIEQRMLSLQAAFPRKLAVRIAYNEGLAHRIEAGCDLYVMPSRYEPCGLNQMYSLRYGTPPIVRATGGLDDTIIDAHSPAGTGFKFDDYSAAALGEAWRRAILWYHSGPDFLSLVKRAMAQDFSWAAAARQYASLYLSICPGSR